MTDRPPIATFEPDEPERLSRDELLELRGEVHFPPRPRPRARRDRYSGRAEELLSEGRVEVIERSARRVVVEVAGSSGERRTVTHDTGRWHCECPAFRHRHSCAHLDATRLIVAAPGFRRFAPPDRQRAQLELRGETES